MEIFKPNLSWVGHGLRKLWNSRFWHVCCWRFGSFGMRRSVVWLAVTDVLKHRNAFIFTAKQTTNNCLTLEDERIMSFRNVENYQPNDTSHIRRLESTQIFLHTDLHVGRSLEEVCFGIAIHPLVCRCWLSCRGSQRSALVQCMSVDNKEKCELLFHCCDQ